MTARLRRLRAEVGSDRAALVTHLQTIAQTALDGPAACALVAWALHHGYSAVESILERVARTIEGDVPSRPDWHKALLDGAALDITGVRPPLLRTTTVRGLHDLRSFRHFVRHAYTADLDAAELQRHQEAVSRLAPELAVDLDAIEAWLDAVIAAAEG